MLGRKIEMRMVKDQPQTPPMTYRVPPDVIAEIANEFVTRTTVTVGVAISAVTALKTICKITEIVAKAKFK